MAIRTWTHERLAAHAKCIARFLRCREAEVTKDNILACTVPTQDVLWLQVAVINSMLMACINSVQDLKEDLSDALGVADDLAFADLRKHVATRAKLGHDIYKTVLRIFDDIVNLEDTI